MKTRERIQETSSLVAMGIHETSPGRTRKMAFVLFLFASGLCPHGSSHLALSHYIEALYSVMEEIKVQRSLRTCQKSQKWWPSQAQNLILGATLSVPYYFLPAAV